MDKHILKEMTDMISYRGPDDEGFALISASKTLFAKGKDSCVTAVTGQLKQVQLASTLNKVDTIAANLAWVTGQMTSNDNSIGLLLNNRKLYDNLDNATTTIDSILVDVKKNPRKYIPPIKIF
ncbi:hypothetical protein [uncultured Muribaculum sp.]|uniref:hypothetical protein n=1 Tax=uncultured Muribaculum sp. TaxID=1918613 RepID=UPI002675FC0C|nr:hypothetical protein [uncultured Muribaculum sp.]